MSMVPDFRAEKVPLPIEAGYPKFACAQVLCHELDIARLVVLKKCCNSNVVRLKVS